MSGIYVLVSEIEDSYVSCDIESTIVFFIYKYLRIGSKSFPNLNVILDEEFAKKSSLTVNIFDLNYILRKKDSLDELLLNCHLPAYYLKSENYCITGLCAVLRQMVKVFGNDYLLLGFRKVCLSACAEFSIWTKFCEVDLIASLKIIFNSFTSNIPEDLIRLEYHLHQPVRMHNINKKRCHLAKQKQIPQNGVEHVYVEGPDMLISDLIILLLVDMFFRLYGINNLSSLIPLTYKWYNLMLSHQHFKNCLSIVEICELPTLITKLIVPEVKMGSLYKCDPRRYKCSEKLFTKQEDVERALNIIDSMEILKLYEYVQDDNDENFDWTNVSYFAHPKGGNVPNERLTRKMQQLENIVKSVLQIAEDGDIIVDFCCGVGHVGILVAYLQPKCSVILLDNKEHSLKKALERIRRLNLQNISIVQSNVDYFKRDFQIGVTLHACGVAADIVTNICISNRSKFVTAPCCYGKLQKNHILDYPRSKVVKFSSLSERDYMVLGHAADQTHKETYVKSDQGEKCMKTIDVDRCLQAKENSYHVRLSKMTPVTCSPKNNFIVGIPLEKYQNIN